MHDAKATAVSSFLRIHLPAPEISGSFQFVFSENDEVQFTEKKDWTVDIDVKLSMPMYLSVT